MRIRRHPESPWHEIDRLRGELGEAFAERDRIVEQITGKTQRIKQLLAALSVAENAGISVTPALVVAAAAAQPPANSQDAFHKEMSARVASEAVAEAVRILEVEGKTRKERVIKVLYQFDRPASPREIADVLKDDYTPVYNALNDLHIPSKNRNRVLAQREEKLWSLTAEGRKEVERLLAAAGD